MYHKSLMHVKSKLVPCQNGVNWAIFAVIHFCWKSPLTSVKRVICFYWSLLQLDSIKYLECFYFRSTKWKASLDKFSFLCNNKIVISAGWNYNKMVTATAEKKQSLKNDHQTDWRYCWFFKCMFFLIETCLCIYIVSTDHIFNIKN